MPMIQTIQKARFDMGKWEDHREAVKQSLKKREKSAYWLHSQVQNVMSRNFLYSYLRGDTGISEDKMHAINKVLNIRFTDE